MLPENWDALMAFLAAQTQWRVGPGGYVGLDYPAVRLAVRTVVADGAGSRRRGKRLRWKDVVGGLGEMETAALEELSRQARERGSEQASRR